MGMMLSRVRYSVPWQEERWPVGGRERERAQKEERHPRRWLERAETLLPAVGNLAAQTKERIVLERVEIYTVIHY